MSVIFSRATGLPRTSLASSGSHFRDWLGLHLDARSGLISEKGSCLHGCRSVGLVGIAKSVGKSAVLPVRCPHRHCLCLFRVLVF